MAFITFVQPDGSEHLIDGNTGASLMAYGQNDGVPGIVGECGGSMSCATCHVHVPEEWRGIVGPATGMERDILSFQDVYDEQASRLSCQIIIRDELDGLKVLVPARD